MSAQFKRHWRKQDSRCHVLANSIFASRRRTRPFPACINLPVLSKPCRTRFSSAAAWPSWFRIRPDFLQEDIPFLTMFTQIQALDLVLLGYTQAHCGIQDLQKHER